MHSSAHGYPVFRAFVTSPTIESATVPCSMCATFYLRKLTVFLVLNCLDALGHILMVMSFANDHIFPTLVGLLAANMLFAVSAVVCKLGASAKKISIYQVCVKVLKMESASRRGRVVLDREASATYAKAYLRGARLTARPSQTLLKEAIQESENDCFVEIRVRVAASEFYGTEDKMYHLNFEKKCSAAELNDLYKSLKRKYPIFLIENPFHPDDVEPLSWLTRDIGTCIHVRLKKAVKENAKGIIRALGLLVNINCKLKMWITFQIDGEFDLDRCIRILGYENEGRGFFERF
ncbi:hypothetical protein TIFTF001_006740 [Ficus carica]|uniref:phosphopyruvate hydratase n=1 Tax=Ficus carica TaxID=3494 RepID=A0AA88D152_FICCA|nr:hypothetical protein TIFTF001_006740 [Ficus carica]